MLTVHSHTVRNNNSHAITLPVAQIRRKSYTIPCTSVCGLSIYTAGAFSHHLLNSLLKSQMDQFYSTTICFTFIYSCHIEIFSSPFFPQHPSIHPHSVSSGLLPQGLMGYEYSLGLLFSQPVREALGREQERGGSSISLFA